MVSSQVAGSGSPRVSSSVRTAVSQAVQFASAHSKQSSPAISDRVEDITPDEDSRVARQAAAFAAQFMLPTQGSTPEAGAAASSSAADPARLMAPPAVISAAQGGQLRLLQTTVQEQDQRLQGDIQSIKDNMAGFVTTADFNDWGAAMNQQVAQFLQDGLAEVARDVQLQLQGIREECTLMIDSALPALKGAGKAPEGDPEAEHLAGSKRKLLETAAPLLLPDLGSAMATSVVAKAPLAPTTLGREDSGLVTASDGMKYPAFAAVRIGASKQGKIQ